MFLLFSHRCSSVMDIFKAAEERKKSLLSFFPPFHPPPAPFFVSLRHCIEKLFSLKGIKTLSHVVKSIVEIGYYYPLSEREDTSIQAVSTETPSACQSV